MSYMSFGFLVHNKVSIDHSHPSECRTPKSALPLYVTSTETAGCFVACYREGRWPLGVLLLHCNSELRSAQSSQQSIKVEVLMMYGPIQVVSNLRGFPLILLSYNSTKSPTEMFFDLMFLSCHSFCCCFWASWCHIAIILSSSSFWSSFLLSFTHV